MRIADQLQVDCPVFYIDNVAEYMETIGRSIKIRDLPSVSPPFDDVWIEWMRGGWRGACRLRETSARPRGDDTPCHRFVVCDTFSVLPATDVVLRNNDPLGFWLDESGALIRSAVLTNRDDKIASDWEEVWVSRPCLLAISFMHCKNVRHVENTPPFNRARRRRGEREWLKFYTLEIDPMKEVLRKEGRIDEVGLKRALHICRGHFATYSGAGLFGKYQGTFWRPSHVRGTAEAGVNVKDYSVKAPKP